MAAQTIAQKVQENAEKFPSHPAYYVKRGDRWQATSWGAYAAEVAQVGKSLMALGIPVGGVVTILGFNRPEWVMTDVAAMSIGAVPAGIYATNSPEEVKYILNHSEAKVILVEDEHQWHKVHAIKGDLPYLEKVVLMKGADPIDDEMVLTWDQFVEAGSGVSDEDFRARLDGLDMDALATLIYTSGTTGPPKAVMLSNRNLAWTAATGASIFSLRSTDSNVSYLPLSHIAEQMFTICIPSTIGSSVYYAESIEKLADNLKEVRPTVFAAVPRVWEKFYAGVTAKLAEATGIKAKLANWALDVGRKANAMRNRGEEPSGALAAQEKLADRLVLSKVREALGLDRARVLVTAAAPISTQILEFFSGLFVINEVYGQSEDTGPTTLTIPGKTKFGSVGIPYPGSEVKIAEDGEILVQGPHVFMGYYKDEEATKEALADGWLNSGDLGRFDEDGFLHITGRKKDIIITAGGKNVAPKPIETTLKHHHLVGEVVVIGDRRKYLTCLVSLDEEACLEFLQAHQIEDDDPHQSKLIYDSIAVAVDELNTKLARVEQVKKFKILPRPLSIDGGELTPTLKVKRNVVADHFAAEIDDMYAE